MRYGKALEEVWAWREKLADQTKNMTMDEQRIYLNRRGLALCEKYGLKVRKKATTVNV